MTEGLRSGAALGAAAVALAILGLTPSLTWIPELPLLAAAAVVPVVIIGRTGFRVAARSSRLAPGALAGSLTGTIGGGTAGVVYLLFGKPALNILVGMFAGGLGGAVFGLLGAAWSQRRTRTMRPIRGGCSHRNLL